MKNLAYFIKKSSKKKPSKIGLLQGCLSMNIMCIEHQYKLKYVVTFNVKQCYFNLFCQILFIQSLASYHQSNTR